MGSKRIAKNYSLRSVGLKLGVKSRRFVLDSKNALAVVTLAADTRHRSMREG